MHIVLNKISMFIPSRMLVRYYGNIIRRFFCSLKLKSFLGFMRLTCDWYLSINQERYFRLQYLLISLEVVLFLGFSH